jgi:adenine-specific DNA glycosylase
MVAAWVEDPGGRLLMFRRPPEETLLADSWELPWVRREPSPERMAEELAARGGAWRLGEAIGSARHTITHRALRVELRLGEVEFREAVSEGIEARWVAPEEVSRLPRSSLVDKLVRRARGG